MPPCLTLSIIRYGSRVKWSNPGKGVAPSPTPWCSKLSKREPSGHPRLWSPTLLTLRFFSLPDTKRERKTGWMIYYCYIETLWDMGVIDEQKYPTSIHSPYTFYRSWELWTQPAFCLWTMNSTAQLNWKFCLNDILIISCSHDIRTRVCNFLAWRHHWNPL